jgi:hypothetical protein
METDRCEARLLLGDLVAVVVGESVTGGTVAVVVVVVAVVVSRLSRLTLQRSVLQ